MVRLALRVCCSCESLIPLCAGSWAAACAHVLSGQFLLRTVLSLEAALACSTTVFLSLRFRFLNLPRF
jgi:hypothetical protein